MKINVVIGRGMKFIKLYNKCKNVISRKKYFFTLLKLQFKIKLKSFLIISLLQTNTTKMTAIINLFKVIGLNVTTTIGESYETKSQDSDEILHDVSKKGIPKDRVFTKYIMFIALDNTYYAIHLSESHCASYGGKLCSIGNMSIKSSDYKEAVKNITHKPLTPIDIQFNLYEHYEYQAVYVDNDPNTCVFEFNYDNNDERTPSGFVYVNMELFNAV